MGKPKARRNTCPLLVWHESITGTPLEVFKRLPVLLENAVNECPCHAGREVDWDYDDPEFPVKDWQFEVANNDTRLGYQEWVEARIAERGGGD